MPEVCDFTLPAYAECLAETVRLYPVAGFEILADPQLADGHFCLIRHDIDMSPERALAVARVEAAQAVRATYMVLLTGPFYSPFERETRETIAAIADLGHDIALHFDAACHGIVSEDGLNEAVAWEAAILRRLFGDDAAKTFSFHNTTPFTMECQAPSYAGLWNAYAGALQKHVSYVSDSNGHWRFRTWREALDEAPARLQVLTHAEWWTEVAAEPADKLCRLVNDRAQRVWLDYVALLQRTGRENRASLPAAIQALDDLRRADVGELVMRWLSGRREEAFLELARRPKQNAQTHMAMHTMAIRVLAGDTPTELGDVFVQGLRTLSPDL